MSTTTQIHEDAVTYDAYIRHGRNVSATARYEFLSRTTIRNRVQRHTRRLRALAQDVALDYAMFESDTRKRHGADAQCTPLDSEYAFGFTRRRHGVDYARDMTGDALVTAAVSALAYARRLVANADA